MEATLSAGQDDSSQIGEKQRFSWGKTRNAPLRVDQYRGILTFTAK